MSPPTEQTTLLVDHPIRRDQVAALAEELALRRVADPPWTSATRHTSWEGDDTQLTFVAHGPSGLGLLIVEEPPAGQVAEMVAARFDAKAPEAVIEAGRAASRPVDVVKAVFAAAALMLPTRSSRELAAEFLCDKLLDERELVRWAASSVLRIQARPDVGKAYEAAAERYPELRHLAGIIRANCQAAEDGTLHDGPTDSWFTLLRRARQGLADEKCKRVEKASEMLLDEKLDHGEGLLLRGLAYEAAGDGVLALGLVGASVAAQRWDRDAASEEDEQAAALERETEGARARLEALVSAMTAEERAQAAPALTTWLERFRDDGRPAPEAGMARALCDHLPGYEPLLCFVAGSFDRDVPLLERALAGAGDSPSCVAAMGFAVRKADEARGESLFRQAMALADASGERSEAAQRIESYRPERDRATKASMLEVLANMAYERQDWDEAGKLGDRLVEADPDTTVGWQLRANARTFALKHQEAAALYEQAIEELTRILDADDDTIRLGADPRAGMHFNLSCVLAKLGQREASLDHLRQAVREEEKFCEQAVEDDYYGELLEDPEFKAIVAQEPRALVLKEELERDFVEQLTTRALGLSHRGDVDGACDTAERAAELAELGEHPDLQIRALSVHGRTLAFDGDPGVGLELLEQAVELAEAQDADEKLLAETIHTHGFVLDADGQVEEAEEAYHRALELRKEAYGEDHPVVAKSYGDLARLVAAQERTNDARAFMEQGTELLERYLRGDPEDDDTRIEALVDLATLRANLAQIAEQAGHIDRALEGMGRAVAALEPVFDEGYTAGEAFMGHAAALADRLVQQAETEEQLEAARSLVHRLAGLGQSADPAIRAEQVFWQRLRRFVARMKSEGVPDEALAEIFIKALRGGDDLPAELRSVPELGGLANELAQRAARYSTFIVMAPLALQTAAEGGSIDQALEDLEGLCVSSLASESA